MDCRQFETTLGKHNTLAKGCLMIYHLYLLVLFASHHPVYFPGLFDCPNPVYLLDLLASPHPVHFFPMYANHLTVYLHVL